MLSLLLLFLQGAEAPDRTWDGWWPAAQWTRDAKPPTEEVLRKARRTWEWIDYPTLQTPWGTAGVSVRQARKVDEAPTGIRLDLHFTAAADALEKGTLKEPGKGEVEAEIVSTAGESLLRPVAAPHMLGWIGRSMAMSGSFIVEFPWLPQSVDDRWIRLKIPDRTVWLLLPYGLGDNPETPLKELSGPGGSPARPSELKPNGVVLAWTRVRYNLGWVDPKGKVDHEPPAEPDRERRNAWIRDRVHVTASLSNPFDGAVTLEMYRELFEPWPLSRPRTTVGIGVPGSRVFFGSVEGIRRDEVLRRYDSFKLWRQPADDRRWGLLRATLEETSLEVAIPGSLFQYTHGRIPEK